MNIYVREATLADLEPLSLLFDAYRVFYEKKSDIVGASSFLNDRISSRDSVIYVALKEDKLVGFVQLYPIYSSTRMKRLWLLNDLFVLPEYRGQGISKVLIERCKEHCITSGSCGMILETAKSNAIGNKLYPSTGFEVDHEHNYYSWNC